MASERPDDLTAGEEKVCRAFQTRPHGGLRNRAILRLQAVGPVPFRSNLILQKIFSGGGQDNPLQYSCLGNPMDRGTWQGAVAQSQRHNRRVLAGTKLFSSMSSRNFSDSSKTPNSET